jgi:PKD repeat protein
MSRFFCSISILFFCTVLGIGQEHHFENYSSFAGLSALSSGHGVVVGDFDGDGFEDLFIPGTSQPNMLLRNMGDSTFQNVISGSGIAVQGFAYTAVWADVDNDHDLDLFVGNLSNQFFSFSNRLYLNDGTGQFTDYTFESGLGSFVATRSILAADVDNDGYTDFYVCNTGGQNILWKNNGDLTFSDVTFSSGTSDPLISMGAIFFDYDNDGDQDLYVTHDANQANLLFRNNGTGQFTNVSVASGTGLSAMGMGVDVADINQDGWFDIYVTNLGPSFLFLNNQDGTFSEEAASRGVTNGGMGWGCFFLDQDNDTDQDLYVVNQYNFAPVTNKLYDNDGAGNYTDLAAGTLLQSTNNGFGGAWLDVDNNGYQDIVIANTGDTKIELYLNATQENHWTSFELIGTVSARDAFGTRVNLYIDGEPFIAEKRSASSYSAQSSHRVHFGLGSATQIDSVHVVFPSGIEHWLYELPVDRMYTVIEDVTTEIIDCIPSASFELSFSDEGELMILGQGDQDIETWTYAMSDGGSLLGPSGTYLFTETGEQEVCLTVQNSCSYAVFCQSIDIACPLPEVSFEYFSDGYNVSLDAMTWLADSLSWNLGDGLGTQDSLSSYTYEEEGIYEICLTAFNACGFNEYCVSVEITCPSPTPQFEYTINGLQVIYTDTSLNSDSVLWNLDDGTQSSLTSFTHDYEQEGLYIVCLTAFNACGMETQCDSLELMDLVNSITSLSSAPKLNLFPNPADAHLFIQVEGLQLEEVYLISMQGKVIRASWNLSNEILSLDISAVAEGKYLIVLRTSDQRFIEELIIQH